MILRWNGDCQWGCVPNTNSQQQPRPAHNAACCCYDSIFHLFIYFFIDTTELTLCKHVPCCANPQTLTCHWSHHKRPESIFYFCCSQLQCAPKHTAVLRMIPLWCHKYPWFLSEFSDYTLITTSFSHISPRFWPISTCRSSNKASFFYIHAVNRGLTLHFFFFRIFMDNKFCSAGIQNASVSPFIVEN